MSDDTRTKGDRPDGEAIRQALGRAQNRVRKRLSEPQLTTDRAPTARELAATGRPYLRVVESDVRRPGPTGNEAIAERSWKALTRVACDAVARSDALSRGKDPVAHSFDLLRRRLADITAREGWKRIAIASPTQGCGASFAAVNLALSLARRPKSRSVLLDLNLHNPGIGRALGIGAGADMEGFLTGRVPAMSHLLRVAGTLAVGANEAPVDEEPSAERIGTTILDICNTFRPDLVLCDLPPILETENLGALLPVFDGVLVVADANRTGPEDIAAVEARLKGKTHVLGVVLNQALRAGPVASHA